MTLATLSQRLVTSLGGWRKTSTLSDHVRRTDSDEGKGNGVLLPETPDGGMEIGISDILAWRECPTRAEFQVRRWTEGGDPPGSTNWTNAYGSAIHKAIHLVTTQDLSNDEAIDAVWGEFGGYLDPEHLGLLHDDINCYRAGIPIGFELVAAEANRRVPLFTHEGRMVYFRFMIDALYRRTDDHTVFYARDYKSSAHRKTQKEVDEDIQMWAYSYAVFSLYPECRSLLQAYEQLKFGTLKTGKSDLQRRQMRAWLIKTVKAMLADTTMEAKQNQFCPYCPLVITCDQTKRSTRYWRGMLAVMAPLTKEGRKVKVAFQAEGDELEQMMRDELPKMMQTRKHIEAVERELKTLIQSLPSEERERLGWRVSDRKSKVIEPDGLRAVHSAMGAAFYETISMSRTAVDHVIGKPKKGEALTPEQQAIKDVELERVSSSTVVHDD